MTYMQRGKFFKQIFANLIIYLVSVSLGSIALVFFYRLWNTTVGHLIIFMSPYLIFTAVNYGYRLRKSKHQNTQEC